MSSTTLAPINTEASFLPTATAYPAEAQEMAFALEQNYYRTALSVNQREIAIYFPFESLTGQMWPASTAVGSSGVPYDYRSTFRTAVSIPPLAVGLNLIPHNIPGVSATFVFTKQLGSIGNGALWVAVPNDNIHLEVDAVNVRITIPAAYVGYTGFVILEYLKTL